MRRPCGRRFYVCLFVLLFMAAPVWRDSPVDGLGWPGLACLDGAVLCRRPACLPLLVCLPFCPVVCDRGGAVCSLAMSLSVWLGWRMLVRLGQFALVSVGVYARLVVSLYCPCLPCIDR